jgi:LmbE family N-acetylglucosaminyl deacetylase
MMKWIYLSPHFDDAVLSCGGLIWKQVQEGDEVEVWTIFGGDPPVNQQLSMFARVLHYRWEIPEDSVEIRRDEDKEALSCLGANIKHLKYIDCIYRKDSESGEFLFEDMENITDGGAIKEIGLMKEIKLELAELNNSEAQIVAPFGVGNHIDHRIVNEISRELRIDMLYYLDFPYVFTGKDQESELRLNDMRHNNYELDYLAIKKWIQAIALYKSQISSFWESEGDMENSIMEYYKNLGGTKLFY